MDVVTSLNVLYCDRHGVRFRFGAADISQRELEKLNKELNGRQVS
jgi:hypothetical protein